MCIHRGKLRQIVVMQCKYGHDQRTEGREQGTLRLLWPNHRLQADARSAHAAELGR